jgi:hypothetical protein
MSPKYIINLLLALAGGFLLVASRVFRPDTAGWLGLGIGIFAVLLGGAGFAAERLTPRSIGYGLTELVGVWTIVSSVVFTGSTLGWLVFANAAAFVAIAVAELTLHEVSTERVVHTLVVSRREEILAR